jgi:hypothetical protein
MLTSGLMLFRLPHLEAVPWLHPRAIRTDSTTRWERAGRGGGSRLRRVPIPQAGFICPHTPAPCSSFLAAGEATCERVRIFL